MHRQTTEDNEIDHWQTKCNESKVLDVSGFSSLFYLVNQTVCLLQSVTKLAIVKLKKLIKVINHGTVNPNRRWGGQYLMMQLQWSGIIWVRIPLNIGNCMSWEKWTEVIYHQSLVTGTRASLNSVDKTDVAMKAIIGSGETSNSPLLKANDPEAVERKYLPLRWTNGWIWSQFRASWWFREKQIFRSWYQTKPNFNSAS